MALLRKSTLQRNGSRRTITRSRENLFFKKSSKKQVAEIVDSKMKTSKSAVFFKSSQKNSQSTLPNLSRMFSQLNIYPRNEFKIPNTFQSSSKVQRNYPNQSPKLVVPNSNSFPNSQNTLKRQINSICNILNM